MTEERIEEVSWQGRTTARVDVSWRSPADRLCSGRHLYTRLAANPNTGSGGGGGYSNHRSTPSYQSASSAGSHCANADAGPANASGQARAQG